VNIATVDLFAPLEVVLVVVGVVVGLGGLGAALWSVARLKGLDATVTILNAGNEALRAEIVDKERRYAADLARMEQRHSSAERSCAEKIARIEGQNAALLDGLGEKIAEAIAGRLDAALDRFAFALSTTAGTTPAPPKESS